MKYIITKDGRIAEIKDNMFVKQSDVLRLVYKDEPCICVLQGKDEIIKQSDTIEELCDGFYLDLGGEFNDIYLRRKDRFEFLKELAFDYMRKGIKVTLYAFIKTSKGLQFVAKMNEKGDLELWD